MASNRKIFILKVIRKFSKVSILGANVSKSLIPVCFQVAPIIQFSSFNRQNLLAILTFKQKRFKIGHPNYVGNLVNKALIFRFCV